LQGLHNYLKKFTYSNAITEDLWQSLAEASGKPVKELMDSWTKLTVRPPEHPTGLITV
jgi:aminopeptidase N